MNIKKIASGVVAVTTVSIACVAPAKAIPVTFANFSLLSNAGNPFQYKNTGPNGVFTLTSSIPVQFSYKVPNAYGVPGTTINAHLTFNAQFDGPVVPGSPFASQELKNVSFAFTADSPGLHPGTNLLTLTSSTGLLAGKTPSRLVNFSGGTDDGDNVSFSSDFLDFTGTIEQDYNFSFSSVTTNGPNGPLGIKTNGTTANGKGNFLSFGASGTGTFDSDPAPRNLVPEPAPIAGFLIGGVGLALLAFRGRKSSRLSA